MPEKGPKFLKESQIKAEAKNWQEHANANERPPVAINGNTVFGYNTTRKDSKNQQRTESIDYKHGISFIREVIPRLIANNPGRKINILDVGAGMTVFTNQIREEFGDQVRVFSTGLSKQAFKTELKLNETRPDAAKKDFPSRLHKDDLKWRSIRELSNFEEFDLIVDTFGEFAYSRNDKMKPSPLTAEELPRTFEYISMIVAKLRPGGLASIAPVYIEDEFDKKEFEKWRHQASIQLGVSFDLVNTENKTSQALYIRKPKRAKEK